MAKVKNMRRYGVLAILLVVALVASLFAMMPVAQAAPDPEVRVQMAVCVDGSGSIGSSDFALMRTGLANAVRNNLPQNSTVELTVIQFADNILGQARVEVAPTVIDSPGTANSVAITIEGMTQAGGWTPTGAAITLATTTMQGSGNWGDADRHIINISTNGYPQPSGEVQNAIDARNAAITAGVTEIDAECVGVTAFWQEWTRLNIVYPPQTGGGHYAPPYDPGFVVVVDTFAEYADAIAAKLGGRLKLEPVTDTNCVCTEHELTATLEDIAGNPIPGVEITFTVTDGPHATTTGTGTTNAAGQATWSYHGDTAGTDTIVATGAGVTSNEVEKIWDPCPELTLEPQTDTNRVCTDHELTATLKDACGNPIPGVPITFTVTGANADGGTAVTDSNGEAVWSYHGDTVGTDTIVATGDGATSNEATKTWTDDIIIPGITVWGIIAAVVVLGGLGVLMLRRRQAYNANRS